MLNFVLLRFSRKNFEYQKTRTMKHKIAAIVLISSIIACLTIAGSNAQQAPPSGEKGAKTPMQGNPLAAFEHPKNLKVLPKNISPEDLQKAMHTFSLSLGVRCGYCHEVKENPSGGRPEVDFVSDTKPEKKFARDMFRMTADINKKYLGKMGPDFEEVTCVSCHRGSPKPMVSVDSLPKRVEMMPKK
jgi:hypothetical protein